MIVRIFSTFVSYIPSKFTDSSLALLYQPKNTLNSKKIGKFFVPLFFGCLEVLLSQKPYSTTILVVSLPLQHMRSTPMICHYFFRIAWFIIFPGTYISLFFIENSIFGADLGEAMSGYSPVQCKIHIESVNVTEVLFFSTYKNNDIRKGEGSIILKMLSMLPSVVHTSD